MHVNKEWHTVLITVADPHQISNINDAAYGDHLTWSPMIPIRLYNWTKLDNLMCWWRRSEVFRNIQYLMKCLSCDVGITRTLVKIAVGERPLSDMASEWLTAWLSANLRPCKKMIFLCNHSKRIVVREVQPTRWVQLFMVQRQMNFWIFLSFKLCLVWNTRPYVSISIANFIRFNIHVTKLTGLLCPYFSYD